MNLLMRLLRGALLLPAAYLLAGGSAPLVPETPALRKFDTAVLALTSDCATRASTECVDLAWRTADADGDGELTAGELETVRRKVETWAAWKRQELPPHTATAISNGSQIVAAIGLGRLVDAFDEDSDGRLTRDEALADIRLDDRPLGRVLADPEAVDRRALSRRLAQASPFLAALIAKGPLYRP